MSVVVSVDQLPLAATTPAEMEICPAPVPIQPAGIVVGNTIAWLTE